MIISALSDYPGMKVSQDLGLVTGFDDKLRMPRTTVSIDEYIQSAQEDLIKKATDKGANAVLGISMTMAGNVKPVLMGTAVILEKVE